MPTKDRADIRIGKLEKKLGLGKGAIRNPDGTDARSDKKLGTLRDEYRSLYGSLPVRKNAGIIAAAAAKPKATAASKKKSVAKTATKPAAGGTAAVKKSAASTVKKAAPKGAKAAATKAPVAKKASAGAAKKKAGTATKGKK